MPSAPPRKNRQQEFFFNTPPERGTFSNPPRPADLGRLPVSVLGVSARARKWLRAHKISDLDGLIAAEQDKVISRKCLDNQIRKELHTGLRLYWNGKKFKYLIALNFLDHGIEKALSRSRVRKAAIKNLKISPALLKIIQKKEIHSVGDLLLQEELKWRNPRRLGNLLVNELLIALSDYLNSVLQEPAKTPA
ncbi:MAG: hypothetical protein P9M08_05395 [Candidatus Erginobacter occultus]|nr:hypothetical protein [Candidatus Erginobacter occultus]